MNGKSDDNVKDFLNRGYVVAFTDGSYYAEGNVWGYGCVLFLPDGTKKEFMGTGDAYIESRQVAGELAAVRCALMAAENANCLNVVIFYDYNGVSAWADGTWRCNKEMTKEYAKFIDDMRRKMTVEFRHVRGHSGNMHNERADRLAYTAARQMTAR